MSLLARLHALRRNLFHKARTEEDLEQELHSYVDLLSDEKIRAGMDLPEARRSALIECGGFEQVKEACREARSFSWLDSLWQDVRYAGRTLRKNLGFTSVALLSLALGIGANTAIFSVFYTVLVRPLPYKDPGRLLWLTQSSQDSPDGFVLTPEFVAWRAHTSGFDGLIAWNDEQLSLTGAGSPERIVGARVTANFLWILGGIQPALGRGFTSEDDSPAAPRAAVLTHEFWQRHFGADPTVVGRIVLLNEASYAVIGVLPPKFRFPGDLRPDILLTFRVPAQPDWGAQTMGMLRVIGHLREGVTAKRALADLSAISSRYEPDIPSWLRGMRKGATLRGVLLQQQLVGDSRPALLFLLWAVGLLFLIACVNVANLQLGRATVRRREIGLRAALGASRMRLARFLVVENLILAALAGIAGFLLAAGLLHMLRSSSGLPLRDPGSLQVGWALGGIAFILATLSGLMVGLVPALTSPKIDLNQVLKLGAPSLASGRVSGVRSVLVLTQVALALVLLLGSGLLLRSLQNVLVVDPGFQPNGVVTARITLPGSRYSSALQQTAFGLSLLQRVRTLPGVEAVATSNTLPLTGYTLGAGILVDGQPAPSPGHRPNAPVLIVSPEYFHAMGIRLIAGRSFDDRDTENGPRVAVVNSSFAKRFFSSGEAIGKRLKYGPSSQTWTTVVGVVGDVRHSGREKNPQPELFVPNIQKPSHIVNLIVRTKNDPLSLAPSLRSAVWSIDKDLAVYDIATMEERLSQSGARRGLETLLVTSFALLAMCLAAVGIYGVVSETVSQRTGEIGLRMALGAQRYDVVRMVMWRSLALTISGIGIGSIAAQFFVRYLASLLYGIRPTDAATFAGTGFLLLIVALLAGYLPARRAARIDPVTALRCE
jgi:putative ABC transport system permease protein